MKEKISFSVVFVFGFLWISNAQNLVEGSYIEFGGAFHSIQFLDENTIKIEPCQKYESEITTQNETFEFKKMENGEFGWKAYDGSVPGDVIYKFDPKDNRINFPSPLNMNNQKSFSLMHKNNSTPAQGVKTYVDETFGGYARARVLVTNPDKVKTGKCLMHSAPISELNSYLVGTYDGVFDSSWQSTFNADFTGSFLGLPMTWSLLSDDQGKLIKWGGDNFFVVFLMIEFEGQLPLDFDPAESGKTTAGIYGAVYYGDQGYIEIHQMQKKL